MSSANKQHKDRVFKFIFGNPEHKEWTLSLYNALTGSEFTNPDDVVFNTIDDAVYMGMKNDLSFIIALVLNIWEHQSSFNPNIPLRVFLYLAHILEKYLADKQAYRYGSSLVKIPRPKFVCFYNGTADQPDEVILKLSDAFESDEEAKREEPELELKVRMLNINYGHNRALMEKCRPMIEYSWFIDAIRRHKEVLGDLEAAIDAAIDEMPEDFLLKKFLVLHRAEVKGMYLTEWDEEEAHAVWREEGREEGLKEGRKEGMKEGMMRVASDMLKKNYPLEAIMDISRLSREVILNLAHSLGVTVA